MRFREKSPLQIAEAATRAAEQKEAEGCSPCAETYRRLGRRELLRAGVLASGALAVSMADVGALTGQAAQPRKPDLVPADAGALSRRLHHDGQVRRMTTLVGPTSPVAAFAGTKADWSLLIEQNGDDRILSVLTTGTELHPGALVGDTAYLLQHGQVVVSQEGTRRWREARAAIRGERPRALASTLAGLAQPVGAEAACPYCPAIMGSCVLFIAACGTGDCPMCCMAAVAICAQAFSMLLQSVKGGRETMLLSVNWPAAVGVAGVLLSLAWWLRAMAQGRVRSGPVEVGAMLVGEVGAVVVWAGCTHLVPLEVAGVGLVLVSAPLGLLMGIQWERQHVVSQWRWRDVLPRHGGTNGHQEQT